MPLVGETVKDGHARVGRKLFDRLLREAAVFDRVIHLAENACGILHAFLVTELRRLRIEERRVRTLVVSGDFKRSARARRGLFENERDVFAAEHLLFRAHALSFLEIDREVDEIVDFGGRMVNEREKTAVFEIERHDWRIPFR